MHLIRRLYMRNLMSTVFTQLLLFKNVIITQYTSGVKHAAREPFGMLPMNIYFFKNFDFDFVYFNTNE